MAIGRYNGWSSWETWNANLHYSPARQEDVGFMEDAIQEAADAISNEFLRDVARAAFRAIDFQEIRESLDDYED